MDMYNYKIMHNRPCLSVSQVVNVGIIGATGYAGAELVRILSRHPGVELVALTTRNYAGKPFWEVY